MLQVVVLLVMVSVRGSIAVEVYVMESLTTTVDV